MRRGTCNERGRFGRMGIVKYFLYLRVIWLTPSMIAFLDFAKNTYIWSYGVMMSDDVVPS